MNIRLSNGKQICQIQIVNGQDNLNKFHFHSITTTTTTTKKKRYKYAKIVHTCINNRAYK